MSAKTTFKVLDVEDTINTLPLSDKIKLLGGKDIFTFAEVLDAGVPSIRCSDGPNGLRGRSFFNGTPASCFPCGTGLAASFNSDLVEEVGSRIGDEARAKSTHLVLGPTVNIIRSPTGGRGFECYSEDPVASGMIASAFIRGVQSKGAACSIKHFVGNEQEFERFSMDSVVSQRALREIYLEPFRLAVKHSKPLAFMCSYNLVNGTHVSDSKELLTDVLRTEWGWRGLVLSDWTGVYSVSKSIKAGLDVEMPGPPIMRGLTVNRALQCGKLTVADIDERIRNILELVNHAIKSEIPFYEGETPIDTPELRSVLRQSATEAIVLLKNDNSLLPLSSSTKSIAVIGSNARVAVPSGGGSAALASTYTITPLDGITEAAKEIGATVDFAVGATAFRYLPFIDSIMFLPSGDNGAFIEFFKSSPVSSWFDDVDSPLPEPAFSVSTKSSNAFMADGVPYEELGSSPHCRLTTTLKPDITGEWSIGLTSIGISKLFINGKLVVDNVTNWKQGELMFGYASLEARAKIHLEAGKEYKLEVRQYLNPRIIKAGPFALRAAIRIGAFPEPDAAVAREEAVALAKKSDVAVVVVGLNNDFESEGFDREHLRLPGASDELVAAVLAANPKTVIVTQSGTPVSMPWINKAGTIVHAFFGGNELGNALADVLFGKTSPSGKLPVTFPVRLEDNPAYHSFGKTGETPGKIVYGEGVFVGYRHYERTGIKPLFPFGHGLSYTSFDFSSLEVSSFDSASKTFTVSLTIKNTGAVKGQEVVQAYIAAPVEGRITSPAKELKAFKKVSLAAGQSTKVTLTLEKEAFGYYNEQLKAWVAPAGVYGVLIGSSSVDIHLKGEVELKETFGWVGM